MNYKKSFEALQRFNRDQMGDTEWINWYIKDCHDNRGHDTIVVPSGRYNMTGPVYLGCISSVKSIEIPATLVYF